VLALFVGSDPLNFVPFSLTAPTDADPVRLLIQKTAPALIVRKLGLAPEAVARVPAPHTPFVHVASPAAQVPQLRLFPQPSGAVPHFKLPQATGCDFGTHAHVPGLPLHESPEGHAPLFVPHSIVPPQPSDVEPQL